MPMMATTIINSMRVKPFCSFVISKLLLAVPVRDVVVRKNTTPTRLTAVFASRMPSASRYVNFPGTQGAPRAREADTDAVFDILRCDVHTREANNGHKLTKIVSAFVAARQRPPEALLDAELLDAVTQGSKRQAQQLRGGCLVV